MSECPMCDCCEVAWAAPLGDLWHACCRACGWVFHMEVCDVVSTDTEVDSGDVQCQVGGGRVGAHMACGPWWDVFPSKNGELR
jgi:hypothetical protein